MQASKFMIGLIVIFGGIYLMQADDSTDIVTMKRPFCNAFTGCGRKRDPAYAVPPAMGYAASYYQPSIPLFYRALRIPTRNIAAEVRLRQRLAEEAAVAGFDPLVDGQQLPILPRPAYY